MEVYDLWPGVASRPVGGNGNNLISLGSSTGEQIVNVIRTGMSYPRRHIGR